MNRAIGQQAVTADLQILGIITNIYKEDNKTIIVIDDSYEFVERYQYCEILDLYGVDREHHPALNPSYIRVHI